MLTHRFVRGRDDVGRDVHRGAVRAVVPWLVVAAGCALVVLLSHLLTR